MGFIMPRIITNRERYLRAANRSRKLLNEFLDFAEATRGDFSPERLRKYDKLEAAHARAFDRAEILRGAWFRDIDAMLGKAAE